MSQSFRIETLSAKSQYEGSPNKGDYTATFEGSDIGEVLIFHNSESKNPAPHVGEWWKGDLEKDKRGNWRLRKAEPSSGPSDTSSSSGGGYGPADIARMSRSHAQEMALRFAAATGALDGLDLDDAATVGKLLNGPCKRLTDWFTRDVENAEAALVVKAEQQRLNGTQQQAEVPADMSELQPVAAFKSDEDIPF